jgi:hypothetical protein
MTRASAKSSPIVIESFYEVTDVQVTIATVVHGSRMLELAINP